MRIEDTELGIQLSSLLGLRVERQDRYVNTTADTCPHLKLQVAERINQMSGRPVQLRGDFTWRVICHVLSRAERDGNAPNYLVAAKHLLALGDYSDAAARAETGKTLSEVLASTGSRNTEPSQIERTISARKAYAVCASGIAKSGDRSLLNPSKKVHYRRLITAVAVALETFIQSDDFYSLWVESANEYMLPEFTGESRGGSNSASRAEALSEEISSRPSNLAGSSQAMYLRDTNSDMELVATQNVSPAIAAFGSAFAAALDSHSPFYPEHLTPSVLAAGMTISGMRSHSGDATHNGDGSLYGQVDTAGGRNALEVLREVRHAVVLGDPGGGKTTIAMGLAIAELRSHGNPLFLACRLPDVVALLDEQGGAIGSPMDAVGLLIDTCAASFILPALGRDDHLDFARHLVNVPKALIVLDGYDEVPPGDRRVARLLAELSRTNARLVLTSRHTGYRRSPLAGAQEYNVDHLSLHEQRKFLRTWFTSGETNALERAESVIRATENSSLGSIPVLLGIIAIVARDDGDFEGRIGHENRPQTAAGLYTRYLSLFLQKVWREDQQGHDEDELISRRWTAAHNLAWVMAIGRSESVRGSSWLDVSTHRAMAYMLREGDRADLERLLRFDGLLVPHGVDRYGPEQQYRWLHKTLHEHLVGAYLSELFHKDRDRWRRLFVEIVQASRQVWSVSMQHMMELLDERSQLEVYRLAENLHFEGDPGGVIADALAALATGTRPGSIVRKSAARVLARRERWEWVRNLGLEIWRAEVLDALADSERQSRVLSIALFVRSDVDYQLAHAIDEALDGLPTGDGSSVVEIINSIAEMLPDRALSHYIERVRNGLRLTVSDPKRASAECIDSVRNAMAGLPLDAQAYVYWYLHQSGEMFDAETDADGLMALDLVAIVDQINRLDDSRRADTEARITLNTRQVSVCMEGKLGPVIAFELARSSLVLPAEVGVFSPWTAVGRWLQTLQFLPFSEKIDEFSPTFVDAQVLLESSNTDSLYDPETAALILRSACRVLREPRRLTVPSAIGILSRFRKGPLPENASLIARNVVPALEQAMAVAFHAFLELHSRDAITALMRTPPLTWQNPLGSAFLPFLYVATSNASVDVATAVRLVEWARPADYSVFQSFEMPESPQDWVDQLASNGLPVDLLGAEDIEQIAGWLSIDNALAGWRQRLLDVRA